MRNGLLIEKKNVVLKAVPFLKIRKISLRTKLEVSRTVGPLMPGSVGVIPNLCAESVTSY